MIQFLFLLVFTQINSAQAALTLSDKQKLSTVTLHTEIIPASKRVYLAADFEANHKEGLISCEVTVEHKNGESKGVTYKLSEETTLLPGEKISFNLGLFPEKFHASGLDVKALLVCQKMTFFSKMKEKKPAPLLKKTEVPPMVCCRINRMKIICASQTDDAPEVTYTEFESPINSENLDMCYPEQDE